MATIHIDRLLETCIREDASEAVCQAGHYPSLKIDGQWKPFGLKRLNEDDCKSLMQVFTPDAVIREFKETGTGRFRFNYGDVVFLGILSVIRDCVTLVLRPTRLRTTNG